jgi:metal-responsive CopG/Arc/MetJ family transcriptional regulator
MTRQMRSRAVRVALRSMVTRRDWPQSSGLLAQLVSIGWLRLDGV